MTVDDFQPPKEGFSATFLPFLAAAHISEVNCDEMAGDRPRQPAYEIFSIQGGRRRRASKTATPLESGYFTAIISCSAVSYTHLTLPTNREV